MRLKLKKTLLKYLSWAITFIGLAILSVTIHEGSHLLAAKIYGIGGIIHFHVIGGTFFPNHSVSWIVYSAGGMGAALFLMIFFWLVPRLTKSTSDSYLEIAAVLAAISNMLYSWWEVKMIGETWWIWAFLGNIFIVLAFLYYKRHQYIDWFVNNNK